MHDNTPNNALDNKFEMTHNFREAITGDIQRLIDIVHEASQATVFPEQSPEGRAAMTGGFEQSIRNIIEGNDAWALCAMDGDEITGFISMARNSHCTQLFVSQQCQGRGIGTALFNAALSRCRASGNTEKITVRAAPSAVGFYNRLGFTTAGDEQQHHHIRYVPMQYVMKS